MQIVRLDAHAHLYDCYPLTQWCTAALRGLRGGDRQVTPAVVVLDREGQDAFTRFQHECSGWSELSGGNAGICTVGDESLLVIRGAQYIAHERIEVLGLGSPRMELEGRRALEIVRALKGEGGVPCLPWSPGKWLGARGCVVKDVLDSNSPRDLTVGDVAIRSRIGPPSSLLAYARQRSYRVVMGTDPLPFLDEERLVGSFGQELQIDGSATQQALVEQILRALLDPSCLTAPYGVRNDPVRALRRFIASNLSRPVRLLLS